MVRSSAVPIKNWYYAMKLFFALIWCNWLEQLRAYVNEKLQCINCEKIITRQYTGNYWRQKWRRFLRSIAVGKLIFLENMEELADEDGFQSVSSGSDGSYDDINDADIRNRYDTSS